MLCTLDYPNVDVDLNSPLWITYSSGTTGIPKGIVHTNNTLSSYLLRKNKLHAFYKSLKLLNLIINLIYFSFTRNPSVRRKKLYTNLMIHGSGLIAIISGALSYEDSYIFSDVSEDSLLRGIHNVQVSLNFNSMIKYCIFKQDKNHRFFNHLNLFT
jgi:acyl-CoA synthetase (AMP-forming)/AMP-acid ligase II